MQFLLLLMFSPAERAKHVMVFPAAIRQQSYRRRPLEVFKFKLLPALPAGYQYITPGISIPKSQELSAPTEASQTP
jgi:hypothetical protein